MPSLNLMLDSHLLQQVRAVAQRDRTTVNAIVREVLGHYLQARARLPEQELRQPEQASWQQRLVLEPGRRSALPTLLQAP